MLREDESGSEVRRLCGRPVYGLNLNNLLMRELL